MSKRLKDIQQRRAALVALSDVQRAAVALQAQRWERPLAFFDAGLGVARAIGARPVLVLLGVAVLARSRWPRLGTVLERASIGWQIYHTFRQLWPTLRTTPAAPPRETR